FDVDPTIISAIAWVPPKTGSLVYDKHVVAGAKRLEGGYQDAWGEYEKALLEEEDAAAAANALALTKHMHLEVAAARENARRLKVKRVRVRAEFKAEEKRVVSINEERLIAYREQLRETHDARFEQQKEQYEKKKLDGEEEYLRQLKAAYKEQYEKKKLDGEEEYLRHLKAAYEHNEGVDDDKRTVQKWKKGLQNATAARDLEYQEALEAAAKVN
ncbi:hypothetical protein T484DRAFT_1761149, partial [Baffinella frigidus]